MGKVGRPRKIVEEFEDGGVIQVGSKVYTCSPAASEGRGAPSKPQLAKVTEIIIKKNKNNLLVLEDEQGYIYYDEESNCARDLKDAEVIYQKQKKIYAGGLLSDLTKFVENPTLLEQINKIREELMGVKDGG